MAEGDGTQGDQASQQQQSEQNSQAQGDGKPTPADIAAKEAAKAAAASASTATDAADSDASPWSDPAKAEAEIKRLRRENGDDRINAKKTAADEARKELLDAINKAINPDAAGETPSAEVLVAQVQDANAGRDSARVEAAALREAWAQGVDPSRADYLQFILQKRTDFGALDANSEELAATLKTMISEEITKDSSLKASGATKGTGDSQFGGADSSKALTLEQFKALSLAERTNLYRTNRAEYDRLNALK